MSYLLYTAEEQKRVDELLRLTRNEAIPVHWNEDHTATVEYSLKLDSNPEFTASVLAACARAVHRMHTAGQTGCKTILDVPPALLSPLSGEELRRQLL